MTPLISGYINTQPMSKMKVDILNITEAYKLPTKILCQYFNAFMKNISVLM